jgi:serine phosphatase RsbU (regulator of sigma subunit)
MTVGHGPLSHRLFLGALPFIVMGAVVVVDIVTGPAEGFLPVLSLGPALASVSRRPVPTALVGLVAVVACVLLDWYDDLYATRRGVIAFVTILGVTVAGVIASAARQRRERELADIRAVAEVAQQVLLRPVPREVPPLRMAVRYVSASASARIGGDLYEVVSTPERVRFILGDVQGKGLLAVRTAATVLGGFREAAFDAYRLAEIADRIELSMRHQAAEEEFVTVVMGEIAAGGSAVEILSCGHPPPLLISDGAAQLVEPPDPGLPLGLSSLASSTRETISVPFLSGDQMLFYTDGVSEARDSSGAFYQVSQCGPLLAAADPEVALDRLRDDVIRHVGHALEDDAAMLLIRCAPSDVPAAGQLESVGPGHSVELGPGSSG